MRRAQIADWIEDLVEFGPDIVSVGVGEWRQTQVKRPTPADIRLLCITEQRMRADRDRVSALEAAPDDERRRRREAEWRDAEMISEGKRIGDEWAQQRGFADLDAYAAAEGLDYVGGRVRVVQSICAASPWPARIGSFQSLASLVGGGIGAPSRPKPAPPLSPAADLGVTAREYAPTAEDMAAGRLALGLVDAEPSQTVRGAVPGP